MLPEKKKREIEAIFLFLIASLFLLSLIFYLPEVLSPLPSFPLEKGGDTAVGKVGLWLASFLYLSLGLGAFLIPFFLIFKGVEKIKEKESCLRKDVGFLLLLIALCTLIGFPWGEGIGKGAWENLAKEVMRKGGLLGFSFSLFLFPYFGKLGAGIILGGIILLSLSLSLEKPPFWKFKEIKIFPSKPKPKISPGEKKEKFPPEEEKKESLYNPPPSSLLDPSPPREKNEEEVRQAGEKLVQTLKAFGVGVEIAEVKDGPVITRYEVKLDPGIKVRKLLSLSSDLSLALAVPNVRIEVPVAGKSLIGVEVPKKKVNFVYLRELLEEEEFKKSKAKLFFPLGKNIAGETVWVNLEDLPHLLIGGSTGSGKSVCINSLIVSILYRCSPKEVNFLLIDPKTVELTDYKGIPHLIFPPITEVKEADSALKWCTAEMTRRYQKFNQCGVRDILSYNQEMRERGEEILPRLVVIVDELADLMMVSEGRLEKTICRIAQLGRATGIHLILATQRPSVDVITGLIKANFPSRISFAVASQIDSRTILDTVGAEKLIGHGDMLFSPVEVQQPFRVQGAYISAREVKRVVAFLKEQGEPEYREEIVKMTPEEKEEEKEGEEKDELFEQAKELVISSGRASTSYLQRKLSIGYNRAARIMEELEKEGIVGPPQGSKPREVLVRDLDVEK